MLKFIEYGLFDKLWT